MHEIFAINLKDLRKRKGLTQEALGKLVGVEKAAVCNWEKGKAIPMVGTLIKLSEVLDCGIDDLLEIEKLDFTENSDLETKAIIFNLDQLINQNIMRLWNELSTTSEISIDYMDKINKLSKIINSRVSYGKQLEREKTA